MKKLTLFIFFLIFFTETAYAHHPTQIVADFDRGSGELEVIIYHKVPDPSRAFHFIEKIIVKLNDNEIATRNFRKQEKPEYQTATFKITDETKEGDEIVIEAYCKEYGFLVKTVEVSETE